MADGLRFLPDERDGPTLPIDVFSPKERHIGVAASKEPTELVIGSPLRIGLTLNDRLMLFGGDCNLWAVYDLGPVGLRQNRLVKPPQLHREVVEAAQKDVGGHTTVSDRLKDVGGLGLSNRSIQQGNQGLVLCGVLDALLRGLVALLTAHTLLNDPAPSVACSLGIPFAQVSSSNLGSNCGQSSTHEPSVQNALGLLGILGLEAGVLGFPLGFVHKVKVP